jgi:transcriptional antiterminator NusG
MDMSAGPEDMLEPAPDPAAVTFATEAAPAVAPRPTARRKKAVQVAADAEGSASDSQGKGAPPVADTASAPATTSADVEGEADVEGAELEDVPDGAEWYVLHTYSGYEAKVKRNLEHRIESMGMHDQIFQIVVPVEEEVDIKDGQRRIVERKIFPGYVLVRMIMTDESYSMVRNTPAVTNFVGAVGVESERNRPTPLRGDEVERILRRMDAEEPAIRVSFRPGQNVRIVDGPFTDFHGVVDSIDVERGKVRLMVNFFGRETPVELDFLQVEKV